MRREYDFSDGEQGKYAGQFEFAQESTGQPLPESQETDEDAPYRATGRRFEQAAEWDETLDRVREAARRRGLRPGMPVFEGTRVPVKNLFDVLVAGDTVATFLDDFPSVTRDQVVQVLELARSELVRALASRQRE